MAMDRQTAYRDHVAATVAKHIEDGTVPWLQSHDGGAPEQRPFNPKTGKRFSGFNALWLDIQAQEKGYKDLRWLTLKQATALGAQVRRGEKSSQILYWEFQRQEKVLDDAGKPVLDQDGKPTMRTVKHDRPKAVLARVFNAEQIDGLEAYKAPEFNLEADEHLQGTLDKLGVAETRSAVLATGTKLSRDAGPGGSEKNTTEQLRVGIATYALNRELGNAHDPTEDQVHAKDVAKLVLKDKNLIFRASRDAEVARTWIMEPDQRQKLEEKAAQQQKQSAKTQEGEHMEGRTYLHVPYEERDVAKAAGARWDRRAKSWYAPEGVDQAPLKPWLEARAEQQAKAEIDPVKEFGEALRDHGLQVDGDPTMDGKWHRVPVEGDAKGVESGSYRGWNDDQRPRGIITNFKGGPSIPWVATGRNMDPEERAQMQAAARERMEVAKQEQQAAQEKTSKRAFAIWKNAFWAKDDHPYLEAKGVKSVALKVDKERNLIVPVRDGTGHLYSVQLISPEGDKRFLKAGRVAGNMHTVDPAKLLRQEGEAVKGPVIVSEGYATAATLHEATGRPALVAFNANNLEAVAKSVKERFPESQVLIAADNDHKQQGREQQSRKQTSNVGLEYAKRAAKAVDGHVLFPKMTDAEKEKGLTDFNDLARERGMDKLKENVHKQIEGFQSKETGQKQGQTKSRGQARARSA